MKNIYIFKSQSEKKKINISNEYTFNPYFGI